MAAQNQGAPNMDQFDAFFRRADLDGDGRISGPEAVTFFQGSNLPKNVLAQIWTYADQRKAGFLGRPEFCNALRLITVAQSKRELTPDIVKAALFGPAAAKIPPPQINLPAAPVAPASAPQTRPVAPAASQHFGYSERGVPNASMNQHNFPSHPNQSMRPPQALPTGFPLKPPQGIDASELPRGGNVVGSSAPNLNSSSNWLGGTGAVNTGPRGISTSVSTPQAPVLTSSQTLSSDSKALASSGNGFPSNSSFEGDVFSASTPPQKQEPFGLLYAPSGGAASSAVVPVSSGPQSSNKISSLDSFSAFSIQASGGPSVRGQSSLSPSQQVPLPNSSSLISSGATTGSGNSTADNLQLTWPKMKPTDVQKYTKVFREVDTDRDGKITGEQARNLFLSWRLPREVLKQVWDLSDQDTDSMLSLREFCFALYLMERYREGCLLPAALPSNVMFDETLLSLTGQPNVSYGNAAWGPNAGFGQQQGVTSGQTTASATGPRPLLPRSVPRADGVTQSNQQKSGAPLLKDSFLNLSGNGQQSSISTESIEPTASEKKVGETENVYLDSKEKMEFYRTMMQELVLYKSRCDNRLNEITARASADKNEAESLMKKYEERYKQVADIASKLTIEEARFRDIQERKTELQQAIIKIDQGGSADGILQVRADRIQSDLEDLIKALNDRSRKHGLEVKSAAMVELPTGWQPGIPEQAALWDEDWDKFEDEGFANDLVIDVHKENSTTVPNENGSIDFDATSDSPSQVNGKIVNSSSAGGHGLESDSAYTHSEDESARSPRDSPAGGTTMDSPFQDSSDPHYKQSEADAETHRSFDYSTWGAFDNNDDVDSVWGFNAVNSKDFSAEKHGDFFGSDDFGVKPIKTGSPHSDNVFQRKSPFFDSVPSTPASRFGNSPTRLSEVSGDHFFDNFSRFDSFNTRDGGYSPKHSRFDSMSSSKDFGLNSEKFSRLDSMQSTADFGQTSQKLTRFDSMSSTADFGQDSQRLTRFDSMSSATDFGQNSERLTRFDSTSTRDFGNIGPFSSFDDGDPFGSSGPFKVSSENQAAKKDSDNWRAF